MLFPKQKPLLGGGGPSSNVDQTTPGDIVCGGTCSGTFMDQTPKVDGKTDSKLFLKPGDEIKAWVEKIGYLKYKMVAKE